MINTVKLYKSSVPIEYAKVTFTGFKSASVFTSSIVSITLPHFVIFSEECCIVSVWVFVKVVTKRPTIVPKATVKAISKIVAIKGEIPFIVKIYSLFKK